MLGGEVAGSNTPAQLTQLPISKTMTDADEDESQQKGVRCRV